MDFGSLRTAHVWEHNQLYREILGNQQNISAVVKVHYELS